MKKISFILFVVVVTAFAACTYVVAPQNVIPPSTTSYDTTKRVAVIECWMGHTCIACPRADSLLASLENTYDSSFIAISIHDQFFAQAPPLSLPPCANGNPNAFTEDFQCATGADYSAHFPMGPMQLVTGLVNRKNLASGYDAYKTTGTWAQHVDTVVNTSAVASMTILHNYNVATRAVSFSVHGTWLQTYSGTMNIAVMLTEDSLIGWQTVVTACDSQYVFNHVLRECINTPGSITGTQVFTGTTTVGTTYSYALSTPYTLPLTFNAAHCNLVALLYDVTTGDVLQAWEKKLQ